MKTNACSECDYANWDFEDAYGGGFWFVEGCKLDVCIYEDDEECEA